MFKSLLEVVSVLYDLTTCAMAMESMDSTHGSCAAAGHALQCTCCSPGDEKTAGHACNIMTRAFPVLFSIIDWS